MKLNFPPTITILRPGNSAMAAVATILGFFISSGKFILIPQLIIGAITVFLISGAGMAINDYFYRKTDAKKKTTSNPIVIGTLDARFVYNYSIILFLIGMFIPIFINTVAFATAAIASLLLFIYAAKPQFKITGNFVVASLTGASLIYGGIIFGQITAPLILIAACAFFANLGREITKDLEDLKADKESKKTLAMLSSKKEIIATATVFYAMAIGFSIIPIIFNLFNNFFIYSIMIADAGFLYTIYLLINSKNQSNLSKSSKFSKISMLVALIAFLIGAVI